MSELVLGDLPDLSADDRARIAEAIEHFGEGEHPVPEAKALDFFRVEYARACVQRAREANVGDPVALADLEDRLLAAVTA